MKELPKSVAVYVPKACYLPTPVFLDIGTATEVLTRMGAKCTGPRHKKFIEDAKDQVCIRLGKTIACFSNRDFLELSLKFLEEHE